MIHCPTETLLTILTIYFLEAIINVIVYVDGEHLIYGPENVWPTKALGKFQTLKCLSCICLFEISNHNKPRDPSTDKQTCPSKKRDGGDSGVPNSQHGKPYVQKLKLVNILLSKVLFIKILK